MSSHLIALTRDVSAAIVRCQLTHLSRAPIDVENARVQHAAYERALADAGCEIVRVPSAPDLPDAVFVEDAAVVLGQMAVLARPGAEPRRGEVAAVAATLARYLDHVVSIAAPGTLDGGDVLAIGRRIFVGESTRTNAAGIAQLRSLAEVDGWSVETIRVRGCLHLKSAVTALNDSTVLINPDWVATAGFDGFDIVEVDPLEKNAANALRVGRTLVYPSNCPRTLERLTARGFAVSAVDVSELQKAEGAVTCCSIVFERHDRL